MLGYNFLRFKSRSGKAGEDRVGAAAEWSGAAFPGAVTVSLKPSGSIPSPLLGSRVESP